MMNLRKDKWKIKRLDEISSFKNGFNFNKGDLENGVKVINVFDFQDYFSPNYDSLQNLVADRLPSEDYLLKKNDVLFVRSNGNKDLVGRTLFIDQEPFPMTFSAFSIRARLLEKNILPRYFVYFLKSDIFKARLRSIVQGTYIGNISQSLLANVAISIPPLDEQERIVELFQSVEQAILHAEGEEGNLKSLQKALSNGLASNPPVFGDLLGRGQTSEVLETSEVYRRRVFSDVVECIEDHNRTPLESGLTRFVGLENIEAENFNLQGFGNIEDGTTFTKQFAKGDVLFGKRRAYLKKVAVAEYDGICSSDILVFRAIQKEILPELLPYYVSSDAFINYAVSTSAGSLSPRTKWRDLAGFQLSIPNMQAQEKIADVLRQLSQSLRLISQQKETLKKLKQKLLNEILS